MKIYIKNMKMPKCCGDCKLLYDSFSCILTGELWHGHRAGCYRGMEQERER